MIYRGYKILYDYHTHTVFSHGKGSIEDNVLSARKLGLKAVAISDHSVGHRAHGVRQSSLKKMRAEIDRLNEVYKDIEIYLSMEANFTQNGSKVDITLEELEVMEIGVEDMKEAMKYDVGFVISSDAHASSKVGRLERGIDRAIEAGLDMTRIVNLKKA